MSLTRPRSRTALPRGRVAFEQQAEPERRATRRIVRRSRISLLLAALGAAAVLSSALALDRQGRGPIAGHFDAIIVAGCGVLHDRRPSTELARRIERAAGLYFEGRAPRVLFTGGIDRGRTRSEARVAAAWAHAHFAIPADAMLLEERSESTEENAVYARALLPNARRVVVVTDAYHVFRARRVFARFFEYVEGAASIGTRASRVRGALREVFAVAAYGLLGSL
jgi:uncharacterized SAM-binding protein YcdF (DUF218 family)